jgi:hypothetical protein
MSGKLLPTVCTCFLRILSKSEQDWHTYKDIPSGVALLAEPYNVALDRVADPGGMDSIDRSRADEIAIQHENLLSLGEAPEIIARSTYLLCALARNRMLGNAVISGSPAT